jgi:hypothetical protein
MNKVGRVHIVQDTGSFQMVGAGGKDDTEVVDISKRRQDWGDHGGNEKIGGLIQKTRECAETTATGEEAEEEAVRGLE